MGNEGGSKGNEGNMMEGGSEASEGKVKVGKRVVK